MGDVGYPVIKIKNIKNRRVSINESQFINSSTITSKLDKYKLKNLDVLIAMTGEGSVGRVGRLYLNKDIKAYLNQRVGKFIPDEKNLNVDFLYYVLSSEQYEKILFSAGSGSGQPNLSPSIIQSIEIPYPPYKLQCKIGKFLQLLDNKIENNIRKNEILENMARTIFKSWFEDFDPVHAKAEGHAQAYMDEKTAALFPNSFDDDGLPIGWEKKKFGDLVGSTISGDWGKETKDNNHKDQVYIIRGTDIPSVRNNSKGKVPLRWVDPKKFSKRRLCENDIVIEVSGGSPTQPTGRSLLITKEVLDRFDFPVIPTSFCRMFRPKNEKFALLIHQHLSNLYHDGGTWEYQNQSTGIANFQTKYFLTNEDIILPPEKILTAFNSLLLPILKKANNNENIILSELRDTLLQKLMSGEIRVKDAEREMEAAI